MEISNNIKYIGVNDFEIDLFEGQYIVPNGMAYNSYLILDEKVAILDSVEIKFKDEWLNNIKFGINYFNGINENNNNDAYFKWIKDQGFNAVEIGCRYPHLVESIYGKLNNYYVTKLKEIIITMKMLI